VQFIWISKGENDTTKSKILPNGAIELILNFGNRQKTLDRATLKTEKYFTNYWVAGLQTQPIIIQSLSDTNLVGITVFPGGAYPFFKFPVTTITDQVIEAEWMKEELEELRNTIHDLSDHHKISRIVQAYLHTNSMVAIRTNESVMYVANQIFFPKKKYPSASW
jgi:hypothetical protein